MRHLLTSLALLATFAADGQVEVVYPYNPDGNADSVISAPDLLDLLPIFGGTFTPEEITVNGEGLSSVLEEMQSALDSLSTAFPSPMNGINQPFSREWPLGSVGRPINHSFSDGDFLVPEDSILFVTYTQNIYLDGVTGIAPTVQWRPLPVSSGVLIESPSPSYWLSGILVPARDGFSAILWDFENGDYHVPSNRQFVPRWESDWNGEIEGITSNWTPQNPYINATELTFQSGITLTDYDDFGYLLGYEIEADFVPPFQTVLDYETDDEDLNTMLESMQLILDSISDFSNSSTAFGEKVFLDFDSMKWAMDTWEIAVFDPSTDGILEFEACNAPSGWHISVIPQELDPCDGATDPCSFFTTPFFFGEGLSQYQYRNFNPITIPVRESELVYIGSGGSGYCTISNIIWTPLQGEQVEVQSSFNTAGLALGEREEVTALLDFSPSPWLPWGSEVHTQYVATSNGLITLIGQAECFVAGADVQIHPDSICTAGVCLRSYDGESSFTFPVEAGERLHITSTQSQSSHLRLFFSKALQSNQSNSMDTLSLEFNNDDTVFVSGSPSIIEIRYDLEVPELWSLYGELNGSWTSIFSVPADSITFYANTFDNLDKIRPDHSRPMRLRLDSCVSDRIELRFNRIFDHQPSIAFSNSLMNTVLDEAFEVDLRYAPRVVVDSNEGVQMLFREMYSYGTLYDGNNGNGWGDFGEEGLLGGEDSGRSAVIRLKDGTWVPN